MKDDRFPIGLVPIHLCDQKNPCGYLRLEGSSASFSRDTIDLPVLSVEFSQWDPTAEEDVVFEPVQTRFRIKIGKLARAVDHFELENVKGSENNLLMHLGIPPYAERSIDPMRNATVFRWSVGVVDVDSYEQVFDLDAFDPLANQPDRDWLHQEASS